MSDTYRCFHCKKVFEEDLARQHFGDHINDLPLCIKYAKTGMGGGPHDPYVRLRESEYQKLLSQSERLKMIETHILSDHGRALPENWVYTDSETTLDLMVAEITTLRMEAKMAAESAA
jgi:hypothetical protein